MKPLAKLASLIALAATIVPSVLYFAGMVDHDAVKCVALLGTVVWFIATPLWMSREHSVDADEVEI